MLKWLFLVIYNLWVQIVFALLKIQQFFKGAEKMIRKLSTIFKQTGIDKMVGGVLNKKLVG